MAGTPFVFINVDCSITNEITALLIIGVSNIFALHLGTRVELIAAVQQGLIFWGFSIVQKRIENTSELSCANNLSRDVKSFGEGGRKVGGQGGWRKKKKKKWCVILARCMDGRERRARLFHTMHYIYTFFPSHTVRPSFSDSLFVGRTDRKSPQHQDGPYRSSSAQLHVYCR